LDIAQKFIALSATIPGLKKVILILISCFSWKAKEILVLTSEFSTIHAKN
jgi:hypothetical protein